MDEGCAMIKRFPRLDPLHPNYAARWARLKQAFSVADEQGIDALLSLPLPDIETERIAASGGPRATEQDLVGLKDVLNAAMYSVMGFPDKIGEKTVNAEVDRALCKALGSLDLPVGEMLRRDVWCWICIHLMPHYVYWRWWDSKKGAITNNRVMGGIVRNALGRLWLRATVLDLGADNEDRWRLLDRMNEDACTALLERTTISSNHRLSHALIDAWLKASKGMPRAEEILRTAMVRARVQTSVIETAVLNDVELEHVADVNFTSKSD
jgi:hypothetical protein